MSSNDPLFLPKGRRYPEPYTVWITGDLFDRIVRLKKGHKVAMADQIRGALEELIPRLEAEVERRLGSKAG